MDLGPSAPLLPNGQLDMEEPDEDNTRPTPTRPVTPPPVIVQPEAPNNGGNRPDVPIIIVDPNRPPAPAPQPTKPTTSQPPVVNPNPSPNPAPAPTTNPTNNTGGTPVYHTVVAGETLYGISRRYNITVDQLKSLNGLTQNTIQAGMQLRVK